MDQYPEDLTLQEGLKTWYLMKMSSNRGVTGRVTDREPPTIYLCTGDDPTLEEIPSVVNP